MKKKLLLFIIVLFLFQFKNVYAEKYEQYSLIPIDTVATVHTESFEYNEFVFHSGIDDKGNGTITFNSIKNISGEKRPVSINILLFDSKKLNIGLIAYCTDYDISTEFSDLLLPANDSVAFYINVVVNKYFVEKKSMSDVKYISVLDDNKYCKTGGSTKYAGLTIDKIKSGGVSESYMSTRTRLSLFFNSLKNKSAFTVLFIGFSVLLFTVIIIGVIVNSLHVNIYHCSNILSFVPIGNIYVLVKDAFGSILAKYYMIVFAISVFFVKLLPMIPALLSLVTLVSIFIDLYKLITKKYYLFLYNENIVKEERLPEKVNNAPVTNSVNSATKEEQKDVLSVVGTTTSSDVAPIVDDPVIDLSHSNNVDTSSNDSNNSFIPSVNTDAVSNNANGSNTKDGESDLSKYFN